MKLKIVDLGRSQNFFLSDVISLYRESCGPHHHSDSDQALLLLKTAHTNFSSFSLPVQKNMIIATQN